MSIFNQLAKHRSFKDLVENEAKSFNFNDSQFLIDLYKWFKNYSQESLSCFKTLSPKQTISSSERLVLERTIGDASFAFNYLKTFGHVFLDRVLQSPKAIHQLKQLFEKNTELSYKKTVNRDGKNVYVFKQQEIPVKFIDEMLKEQTSLEKDQAEILAVLLVGSPEIVSMLVLNYLNQKV